MKPSPPKPQPVALRIELLDVKPAVWRRVLVSNASTLASLHHYLQWIMGWNDTHAHEFAVGEGMIGPDWWIQEISQDRDTRDWRNEKRVSVAAVVRELGILGEFEYRYDMGDGWRHRITFEPVPPRLRELEMPLPVCLAGENACPPDDVGGPPGYADFLEAMGDPKHEQHEDMVRWIGAVFDPKGFDLNRLNRGYRGAKSRRR